MALSLKTRKRLSLLILVVGLPVYIVACVTVVNWLWPDPLTRPPMGAELAIYVGLGVLWAFPLKWVFKGVGQGE
ncbi:MAG: DUF2842 domain-containing protein [Salibaculum sp.]|uniref:DUF2842 domain-containing protein n=1 Tax=Roseovarius halophilus (ex Wu et al. 2025) TaxID=3376060 RepID=UPI0028709603|nr:DUF2842 domain-containing protein [Salibaculum sp.]MDR9427250.1 DUF2842 domain-containing protein [Salibaculum sp.]MDR9482682.1 DUF2842 domain-containing protein [Salibaculum sp.]